MKKKREILKGSFMKKRQDYLQIDRRQNRIIG